MSASDWDLDAACFRIGEKPSPQDVLFVALRSGQSWRPTARRVSVDPVTQADLEKAVLFPPSQNKPEER